MLGIAPSELLLVALVAIVFIGPEELPRVMRLLGRCIGQGRAMTQQVRRALDVMVRDAELAEATDAATLVKPLHVYEGAPGDSGILLAAGETIAHGA